MIGKGKREIKEGEEKERFPKKGMCPLDDHHCFQGNEASIARGRKTKGVLPKEFRLLSKFLHKDHQTGWNDLFEHRTKSILKSKDCVLHQKKTKLLSQKLKDLMKKHKIQKNFEIGQELVRPAYLKVQ